MEYLCGFCCITLIVRFVQKKKKKKSVTRANVWEKVHVFDLKCSNAGRSLRFHPTF